MFSKLLKHDCRAVFKHWWIAAVSSVLFAILEGVCTSILDVSYTTHTGIQAVASILLAFSEIALVFFPTLAALLMFIRFRKHFFSDEGYLTFTLPVSKGALLGSKFLTAMIFAAASIILLEIDVIIIGSISEGSLIEVFEECVDLIKIIYKPYDFETICIGILVNLILIAAIATFISFFFLCITLANMLVKKRRVLLGIGLFYGTLIALTIFFRIFATSGALDVLHFKTSLQDILGVVLILVTIVIFGAGFYLLNLYLLDKKLNLE